MARQLKPSGLRLDGYDDTYLGCRDHGHVWDVVGYYRLDGQIRRRMDCLRCGTERLDRWGSNGARFGSSYAYVEDYRVPEDDDGSRVTTVDVRLEVLARATVYASHDDMLAAMTKRARS
jgi:hypothetical protein